TGFEYVEALSPGPMSQWRIVTSQHADGLPGLPKLLHGQQGLSLPAPPALFHIEQQDTKRPHYHQTSSASRTGLSSRSTLRPNASKAQTRATAMPSCGPIAPPHAKTMATSPMPTPWPKTRVTACSPPAAPLRRRGAPASSARLLGV